MLMSSQVDRKRHHQSHQVLPHLYGFFSCMRLSRHLGPQNSQTWYKSPLVHSLMSLFLSESRQALIRASILRRIHLKPGRKSTSHHFQPANAFINMAARSISSLDFLDAFPPSEVGPGFRAVPRSSYSRYLVPSNEIIDIPDDLNSLQFLLFAGFDEQIAQVIYQAWQISSGDDYWVVDEARDYIMHMALEQDAIDPADDWDGAFRHMGLSEDMRRRILNPAYDNFRLGRSASEVAVETVTQFFEFLDSLGERIEWRRAELARALLRTARERTGGVQ